MTAILWIGFGFLFLIIIFLMITFFFKENLSHPQYIILRFLTSLCAAFAGGFISGEAMFKLDANMADGAKIIISGTTGFALFFIIWFTYQKKNGIKPKDSFTFSIPEGWTFLSAVNGIVKASNGVSEFQEFTEGQLSLVIKDVNLETPSPKKAIESLKHLCPNLPDYEVIVEGNIYRIIKK